MAPGKCRQGASRDETHAKAEGGQVHDHCDNDTSCIDCDICRETAPEFFRRDDDEGATYVWRQPGTPGEIALAEEALLACPTDSIGNDG
ncbi:MAG: ferredoxin [Verrucomicrobiales bacterium]